MEPSKRFRIFLRERGISARCGVFVFFGFSELRAKCLSAARSEVPNFTHVPSFDGQPLSFTNYDVNVIPRNRIATLDPAKRASNLLLNMADVARKICVAGGKDCIGGNGGAQQILRIFRGCSAPDAIGAMHQGVATFMDFKRTDRPTDVSLMEFDVLREKAEARMAAGSGFPDEYVSILCMQNAALSKNEIPWCWPESKIRWRPQRRRAKCGDYLDLAGMRRGSANNWRLIWTPFRRKRISHLGPPIVERKR